MVDIYIDEETILDGVFGPEVVVVPIIFLALCVYGALCLMFIAKKTNTPNGWMAWVPIANVVLILQIAKKPVWWIVLLFMPPLVNIIVAIRVWIGIAEARGKPPWWGVLLIVPLVNLIIVGMLAFSNGGQARPAAS